MAVKSIIDIEVNDEAFKRFSSMYQKYQEQLKKAVPDWGKINTGVQRTANTVEEIVAAVFAWEQLSKKLNKTEQEHSNTVRKTELSWKNIAKYTRTAASSVLDNIKAVAKWTSIGGLVGAGSFFGLDKLSNSVSGNRRSALGLGIGYGAQQAFKVNYGRVVDSDGFLSGVNEALHDVTRRYTLYGAGLTEGDIAGKDTGQVSQTLLQRLKDIADRTPTNQLGQVIQARGLGQFVSLQDLERLKNTSRGELAGYASRYSNDTAKLGLPADTQRRWQDFSVQMSRAGEKLENVLVRGLDKLVDPLTKLSDSATDMIQAFLDSPKLKDWMDDFGKGLENVANYVASDKFQNGVKSFVDDVGTLAAAIHWLVNHIPGAASFGALGGAIIGGGVAGVPGAIAGATAGALGAIIDSSKPGTGTGGYGFVNPPKGSGNPSANNPGNLRVPGSGTGFQRFSSPDDGIRAIQHQLLLYQNRDHINTIRGIESKYSPPSENDTHHLIKQLVSRTGYGADQPLDLNDIRTMATIISGITKQENSKSKYTKDVVITILNNTGGNAVVSASTLPH